MSERWFGAFDVMQENRHARLLLWRIDEEEIRTECARIYIHLHEQIKLH